MGNVKNFLSRFSGIIRLVIFIILVAALIFFAVRFIRNRQASNRAEQVVQSETTPQENSNTQNKDSEASPTPSNQDQSATQPPPRGVADSGQAQNNSTESLPVTGLGSNTVVLAFMLALATYFTVVLKDRRSDTR